MYLKVIIVILATAATLAAESIFKDNIPDCIGLYTCAYERTTPGEMEFKLVDTTNQDQPKGDWQIVRGSMVDPLVTFTEKVVKLEFGEGSYLVGSVFYRKKEINEEMKFSQKLNVKFESNREWRKTFLKTEDIWYIKPDEKDVQKELEKQTIELNKQTKIVENKAKLMHQIVNDEIKKRNEAKNKQKRETEKGSSLVKELKQKQQAKDQMMKELHNKSEEHRKLREGKILTQKQECEQIEKNMKNVAEEITKNTTEMEAKSEEMRKKQEAAKLSKAERDNKRKNEEEEKLKNKEDRIKVREEQKKKRDEERQENQRRREASKKEREEMEEKKKRDEMQQEEEERKKKELKRKQKRKVNDEEDNKPKTVLEILQYHIVKMLRLEFGRRTQLYQAYHGFFHKDLNKKSGLVYSIHTGLAKLIRMLLSRKSIGLDRQ